MLSFRYQNFTPPGGAWFYTVPETKACILTPRGMPDLLASLDAHYRANHLEKPSNLKELVEDHICMRVARGFCCGHDPRTPDQFPPTFFEVTRNMELFYRTKRSFVPQRTADDRSIVCARCSVNSLAMCVSCNGLRQQAHAFSGGRQASADRSIGVCAKMRLPCAALVFVDQVEPVDGLPETCWIARTQ